jgi:pimeloyl-ACP methyl ester carboxylesterase
MRQRLSEDPGDVVSEFRAFCGCTSPAPEMPEMAALDAGLAALETWDERPVAPMLALCGETDTLISPALSNAFFSEISWHPGGHLLPLEAPNWCAAQLAKLLA